MSTEATETLPRATPWAIFPCHSIVDGECTCGQAACGSPGKHPLESLVPHGCKDATTDPAQHAAWWKRHPQANLAIATGRVSDNLVVIDIDPDKGGWESLLELEAEHGKLPDTVEVETGGDGWHGYYRNTTGEIITCRNGWRAGIDIKAEGGYVVAPPSNHKSGKQYAWKAGHAPGTIEIADLPEWLVPLLPRKNEPPKPTTAPALHVGRDDTLRRAQAYIAKAQAASEGNRNDAAFRLAGHIASFGVNGSSLGASDIISLLSAWNLRNNPPLPEDELRQCVASALVNGTPRKPKGMPDLRPAEYRDAPAAEPRKEITYQRLTSAELATGDYRIDYAIEGAMVEGQPLEIGGPTKALKTSLLVDAAVSLSDRGYFLGHFKVNGEYRVGVMSGESGMGSLQEIANRVCRAAGKQLADLKNLLWSPDIPKLNSIDHLEALDRFIAADGIEILFLDPAYLMMPSFDAGNIMAQGELLRNANDVCTGRGTTLVICHHSKRHTGKDPYEPLELQDLSWAGHAEFARQWWLVNRREKYEPGTGDHRLWLNIGGSAGHNSLWAVDINEGTINDIGGRRWEVALNDAAGARDAASERRKEAKNQGAAERLEGDRKAVCEAVAALPDRAGTKSDIKAAAGLNNTRLDPAVASLLRDKMLIPTTITKSNKQSYEAFTLA